jgi:hypothetical protein
MKRIVVVAVALVICAASATTPRERTINTAANVTASFEDTWRAVIEAIGTRKWSPVETDKLAGTIATEWVSGNADAADCGTAILGTDRDPKFRVTVYLRTYGATTTLNVDAAFQRIRMYDSPRTIDCVSKGTLEAALLDDINLRLKLAAIAREKEVAQAAHAPFYCAPTMCARSETGCAKLAGATCAKATKAVCFIGTNGDGVQVESCHPTIETCKAQRAMTKLTDPGECS